MPAVCRQTDNSSGACGHPPSPPAEWSPNVFANGLHVVRLGDVYSTHPDGFHPGRTVSGASSTVFANGRPLARLNDSISCGDTIGQGSPTVSAGG